MTLLVQFELTPQNPNETELTTFLSQINKDTADYPGCRSVKFFTSLDESANVILLEEWDNRASFNDYFAWRTKRGDFANLLDLLNRPPNISYQGDDHTLISEVRKASMTWKTSFNSGNASACAGQYEQNAVLHATPIGKFQGTDEIRQFWENIINDGFADVQYIDPQIEIINEKSAILRSNWKMNKAAGKITKELWVIQNDGSAKLREDNFKIE